MKDFIVIGIESSCDETSCAVIKNGREVLSNIISSQVDIHKKFGGVVPEVASRKHVEVISNVVKEALEEAKISLSDIDLVAATYGPGLVGALLVGLSYAKGLALSLNKPFVGVNHIEGHIAANYIAHKDLEPPYLCLVVSGGHTHLVLVKDYTEFEVLGRTRDDAAGEAYDKVARALGLGYPGGPLIDRIAKEGNEYAVDFPKAYLEDGSFDFSFSGLKSAVLNYLNKMNMTGKEIKREDVAASFQRAVVEILVEKTVKAAQKYNMNKICLAGGVAANSKLKLEMSNECEKRGIKFYYPPVSLCTDNAAMIAAAGYYNYKSGIVSNLGLNAYPSLKIGQRL
ncbi:tRNA (adenosine(37)-N6)-threonylcarbamoyltransferase complex transferase subunit TsaD [Thermobrachium celere]|uniref:tRNA N6-adenosine threonylcarbamoyltransferase n=1 Tax=Thermobrachium celere DSM 8682 TaxID=941824 RepID=R7RTZ6_9CLOT|nr:tRNA (adenosine(37)-N6)-threonylcarbamoyltransferase complex transferase subunit TsaD [Thermobrachium celere]CDF58793.1 YgjD/Kae1/Qri7 family, required for threonylcarbamoyladenosine (t(6)A) formation in tRNA [Thermobrachium celere DSM 8682]